MAGENAEGGQGGSKKQGPKKGLFAKIVRKLSHEKPPQGQGLKVTPKPESPIKEQFSPKELQDILLDDKFQRTANAYRVIEMTEHSINLYGYFPDSKEPLVGQIEPGKEWNEQEWEREWPKTRQMCGLSEKDKGRIKAESEESYRYDEIDKPKLRLSDEDKKMLTTETEAGKDLISNAFLYTCFQEYPLSPDNVIFLNGHSHRGSSPPLSLDPLKTTKKEIEDSHYDPSFRGLFIRMGGKFSNVRVLSLDPGGSRWLYDWYRSQGQEDRFEQGIVSALMSDGRCSWGKWIHEDNTGNNKVVIADHDYNIEKVIPLSVPPTPGVERES